MMLDVTTVLGEAAAVVDPKGESEDLSVLCGLVAWALEHPDRYSGWDAETLSALSAGRSMAMLRWPSWWRDSSSASDRPAVLPEPQK